MRKILLAILVTVIFPIAVSSESYDAGLARIQLPKIFKLYKNGIEFFERGDYEAACSKFNGANLLLEMNFEGLQELFPDTDWFEWREETLEGTKGICNVE